MLDMQPIAAQRFVYKYGGHFSPTVLLVKVLIVR